MPMTSQSPFTLQQKGGISKMLQSPQRQSTQGSQALCIFARIQDRYRISYNRAG
jgi:hypothetical protein